MNFFSDHTYEFKLLDGSVEEGKVHVGETTYFSTGNPAVVALAHKTSSGTASTIPRLYIPWHAVVSFQKID
jgi:hypothetical protein